MAKREEIKIEGLTVDELLALPHEDLDALMPVGPFIIHVGSAVVLGEVHVAGDRLVVQVAQIDGGGEGVVPALIRVAEAIARRRGLKQLEWMVHALNCARPNPKLRPWLERAGFEVKPGPDGAKAYCLVQEIGHVGKCSS